MTTSDRVLAVMATWLTENGWLPADAVVRLRDWDGDKATSAVPGDDKLAYEVVLDADEPEEHEVLRGVDTITGSIILDVNVDDTSQEQRQEMLSDLSCAYDVDDFLLWANDSLEERGLLAGEDVKIFDLRMAIAGSWEPEGRRQVGRIAFEVVACPVGWA